MGTTRLLLAVTLSLGLAVPAGTDLIAGPAPQMPAPLVRLAPDLMTVAGEGPSQQQIKADKLRKAKSKKMREKMRRNRQRTARLNDAAQSLVSDVQTLRKARPGTQSGLMKKLKKQGGEFYAAQTDVGPDGKLTSNGKSRLEKARAGLAAARRQLLEIEAMSPADQRKSVNKTKAKLARKRLKDLGGDIEVEAHDAMSERRALAKERGMHWGSPFLDAYVPRNEYDNDTGLLVSQGERMICGRRSAAMAASCKNGISLDELNRINNAEGFEPTATAADLGLEGDRVYELGLDGSEIVSLLRKGNVTGRVVEASDSDAMTRAVTQKLQDGGGPLIVSVGRRRTGDKVDTGLANFGWKDVPGGDGLESSPSLREAGVMTEATNRYSHWLVADGIVNIDSGDGAGPHVAIRDPDGGRAYFVPLADFQAKFSGDAVELVPDTEGPEPRDTPEK